MYIMHIRATVQTGRQPACRTANNSLVEIHCKRYARTFKA